MPIEWIEQPRTLDRTCPVCGAPGAKRVRLAVDAAPPARRRLQLLDCAGCGSAFYDDLTPPIYERRSAGAGSLKYYVEQGAGIDAMLAQIARVGTGRVDRYLEIGCGFGFSLDFARFTNGWTVKGLDPSPFAAAGRELLGVDIDAAYLTANTDLGAGYDLVFLSEVIEHLPAPGELLRLLVRSLSRRGTLMLTTPNVRAAVRGTTGGALYRILAPGRHLVLYSAAALEQALVHSGFTHVRVREQEHTLSAAASLRPLKLRDRARLNRTAYRRYLGARLAQQPPDSPLAHGLNYRLFKELVNAGSYRKADLAFEGLRGSYLRVYGIDLDRPDSIRLEALAGLPFEEFSRRCPFNLCCVLFFQGLSEFIDRKAPRRAVAYLRAAVRAGGAIGAALRSCGSEDGETENLMWQAQAHIILALAGVDVDAALAEFLRAGEPHPAPGEGAAEGFVRLPAALLEATRADLFVRLVAGGAAAAAASMLPGLEAAPRPGPAGRRVALAKLALGSRAGEQVLRRLGTVGCWVNAIRRLDPMVHDYGAAWRSLALRAATLVIHPASLKDLLVALAQRPFRVGFAWLSNCQRLAFPRANFVKERRDGDRDLATATRIAVFSHFDPRGVVHDFVVQYLRQLEAAGFAVIFVSNSPRLPAESVARLRPWCASIIRRANVGYDFGAYKDGIAAIPSLDRLETLLLANDSVYGPFHPLKEIIARMDDGADAWGITDCWERHYHLQSYFLLFRRPALQSAAFARFWAGLRHVNSKHWMIVNGEIGLSRDLCAAGLRCQALFPYRTAAAALSRAARDLTSPRVAALEPVQRLFLRRIAAAVGRDVPLNSTHFLWDYLVSRMGCPFLKRELLRDNPMRVPQIRSWESVVGTSSAYDTSLIRRHLAGSIRKRRLRDPVPLGRPYTPWFR